MSRKYFYLLLIPTLVLSCETVIDLDIPEEEPKPVINAMMTANEPVKVELTKSSDAMKNDEIEAIDGASVVLFREDEPVDTLVQEDTPPELGKPRRYFSENYEPEAGASYSIEVEAEGFDPATAETRIPDTIGEAELVKFEKEERDFASTVWHKAVVEFPVQEGSYYTVAAVVKYEDEYDNPVSEGLDYLTPEPRLEHAGAGEFDQIIEGDVLLAGETELELKEDDDGYIEMELYPEAAPLLGPGVDEYEYKIIIRKVTADYKSYIRSLREQDLYRDNPFAERVSVYSNVDEGFGLVSGYREKSIKLEE